jgi:hypothetical protein
MEQLHARLLEWSEKHFDREYASFDGSTTHLAMSLLNRMARRADEGWALTDDPSMNLAFRSIFEERQAQNAQWGKQHHPDGTGLQYRAAADLARARTQAAAERDEVTWRHILEEEFWEAAAEDDPRALQEELIQVAAVAVQWFQRLEERIHSQSNPPNDGGPMKPEETHAQSNSA